jgi:hypothetical protein
LEGRYDRHKDIEAYFKGSVEYGRKVTDGNILLNTIAGNIKFGLSVKRLLNLK